MGLREKGKGGGAGKALSIMSVPRSFRKSEKRGASFLQYDRKESRRDIADFFLGRIVAGASIWRTRGRYERKSNHTLGIVEQAWRPSG